MVKSKGVRKENNNVNHQIDNVKDVATLVDRLIAGNVTDFAVDCEWGGGDHYMDSTGKLRSVQFAWGTNEAAVVILHRCNMAPAFRPYQSSAITQLRRLFHRPGVRIIGHGFNADFPWLYKAGLDLSGQLYFDTMLASHLLDPTMSHKLEDLAVRYLPGWRRHDFALLHWLAEKGNKPGPMEAYGRVPDEILFPYGGEDAISTFRLYQALSDELSDSQLKRMEDLFYREVMPAHLALINMEMAGFYVDQKRLMEMGEMFHEAHNTLLGRFCVKVNKPGFNTNSAAQKCDLLFNGLGLEKIKTTKKNDRSLMWEEVVEKGEEHLWSPAADTEVLEILQSKSPIVKDLYDITLVSTVLKSFLCPKEFNPASGLYEYQGGFMGHVKADGRIHARISQMLKTGRLASKEPNLMNLPKRREPSIQAVIKSLYGHKPLYIRSCFCAPRGRILIIADYKQAEIATLAYLSGDPGLIKAVQGGLDIHSLVAKQMFKLDCSLAEVKARYGHLRVSAKAILFGLIYGRGAPAIAREVRKAGVECSIEGARAFIEQFMESYPAVRDLIASTHQSIDEVHYVENLWGRRERFYGYGAMGNSIAAAQKRQGFNFLFQSYVGDLLRRAVINLADHKRVYRAPYDVVMTVHDCIIAEVDLDYAEEFSEVILPGCMVNKAKAPGLGFSIDIDTDVCTRWEEALYLQDFVDLGLSEEYGRKYCKTEKDGSPTPRPVHDIPDRVYPLPV